MDKYEDTGISVVDLFKVMYGRKLIVLIVTVSVLLISILAVALGYNMQNSTYVTTFSYNSSDIQAGKYIDGSSFDYRGLVSLEVLQNIKNSDSTFDSVDVEKMYEKGDISIEVTYDKNDVNDTYNVYYKMAIKKKYFKNEYLGKKFIAALTEYPVSRTKNLAQNLNYKSNLTLYDSAFSYENMILYLQAQLDYLDTNYTDILTTFGDSIINDKKISTYKNEVDSYFNENKLTDLSAELETYCYVKDSSVSSLYLDKAATELEITKINAEIATIETQIERLLELVKNSGTSVNQIDIDVYNEKLLELNSELIDAQNELNYIEGLIDNANSTDETYLTNESAFDEKLSKSYAKLVEFTDIYKTNYCTVINNNIYVYYTKTRIISEEQGFSIIITMVLGVIGGLALAGIVNLCIDHKKLFKKQEEEITA